jgi:methyltransferase (TIGR00027 family)
MKPNMLLMIQRVLEASGYLTLPNLSNSIGVAKLRYIQSVCEDPEYRNPDTLAREFLSPPLRGLSRLQGRLQLGKLRSRPFYYYLIARTMHYDKVFTDAIRDHSKYIVNIGSGGDTRAYRFAKELQQIKVTVFECDQPQSIAVKQELAVRKLPTDHVTYLAIDLNEGNSWASLRERLAKISSAVLVIIEGVSSYIEHEQFGSFLLFLAGTLRAGSRIAYDYKIRGAIDGVAEPIGPAKQPFTLPATKQEVIAYHKALGYDLRDMELSCELVSRLLSRRDFDVPLFREDCLLTVTVQ